MQANLTTLSVFFWLIFWIYWFLSARGNKENIYRHGLWMRASAILVFVFVFVFLYAPFSLGWFSRQIIFYGNMFVAIAGLFLSGAGLSFAAWSRMTLGRNWSAVASIKKDHELVKTGPYAIVRHPMYAGFLLAILGTALIVGKPVSFLAFLFAVYGLIKKIQVEEPLLENQLPEYTEYKKTTKALIPFIF